MILIPHYQRWTYFLTKYQQRCCGIQLGLGWNGFNWYIYTYMEDLSIFDCRVLKSPTIILLLSISFLKSSKLFFMYLDAPTLGTYIFTMFMSSWWILHLSIMKWPSGSLFMAFFLKSILSDMSIATPVFFSCPFARNICFQPFTFSLCRSSVLKWVSCGQHMCGSCFLIHSAILCLLIGALNNDLDQRALTDT